MKRTYKIVKEYYNKAYKEYNLQKICEFCNSIEKIEIHHKDGNFTNNFKENLQILCGTCHRKQHKNNLGNKHTIESLKKMRKAQLGKKTYKRN